MTISFANNVSTETDRASGDCTDIFISDCGEHSVALLLTNDFQKLGCHWPPETWDLWPSWDRSTRRHRWRRTPD
jgi:hypothetical protein